MTQGQAQEPEFKSLEPMYCSGMPVITVGGTGTSWSTT